MSAFLLLQLTQSDRVETPWYVLRTSLNTVNVLFLFVAKEIQGQSEATHCKSFSVLNTFKYFAKSSVFDAEA